MIRKICCVFACFLAVTAFFAFPAFAQWTDVATVSGTTVNHLCYHNGDDIVCTTPSSDVAVSGTIQVGKLKVSGVSGGAGVDSTFSETDPTVGTLTANKWCQANADGDEIVCSTDDPTISALDDIGDVDLTGAATNNLLMFDGDDWVDTDTLSVADITASGEVSATTVNASTDITTPLMQLTPVAGGSGYTETVTLDWDDLTPPDPLVDIGDLTPTNSGFIVGDGSNFVLESGATARTSIGLGTGDTVEFTKLNIPQICDESGDNCKDVSEGWGNATVIADNDGNTKVQVEESNNEDKIRFDTGNTERMVLDENGLSLKDGRLKLTPVTGSAGYTASVELSWDSITPPDTVVDIENLTPTNGGFVVGDGSNLVLESGATARNSIGLGTGDDVEFASLTVDTDTLYVDDSSNEVGIGTTSPNAELHVDGAIQIAGNSAGCSSSGDIGKIKYNSSTGKFQICRP